MIIKELFKSFVKGFSNETKESKIPEVREIPEVFPILPRDEFYISSPIIQENELSWNVNRISEIQPVINGWKLLGIIEHIGRSTLIKNAPGELVPTSYLETYALCNHCQRKLFRRWTFIVQHIGTFEIKQVGSTCVKKFLEDCSID